MQTHLAFHRKQKLKKRRKEEIERHKSWFKISINVNGNQRLQFKGIQHQDQVQEGRLLRLHLKSAKSLKRASSAESLHSVMLLNRKMTVMMIVMMIENVKCQLKASDNLQHRNLITPLKKIPALQLAAKDDSKIKKVSKKHQIGFYWL